MDCINPQLANIEAQLSSLLRERTGYEIADLDRDASFIELGFDSLFLIQLSQQIKQRFRTKISFRQLIEEVTSVDALITYLAEAIKEGLAETSLTPHRCAHVHTRSARRDVR